MRQLAELLKSKNIKVTPQRLAIYNVLYHTKAHPSAEKIFKSLQATHPTMSLATVYKTLDALKEADLVQELNTGSEFSRYDADTSSHPHVICNVCGEVYDLHTKTLDAIFTQVQQETDFQLNSCQMYFYGKCPNCK